MYPHKLSMSVGLIVMELLCVSVQAASRPGPSPTVEGVGRCYPLLAKDWNLITHGNTGKIAPIGNDFYQAKDSKSDIKWEVETDPLKIRSYNGQISAANAVAIILNGKSFLFSIKEGEECVGTTDNAYLDYISKNKRVDGIMHYQLSRFPSN